MRSTIGIAVAVLPVAFSGFVTLRVVRLRAILGFHTIAWLIVVWLVPILGAILALHVCTEKDIPAPAPTAREEGSQVEHLEGGSFL